MKRTLLLFGAAFAVRGQEALSLKDAVRAALDRNQGIAASAAVQDAAAARIRQARSGYLPKVNYQESWARSDNPVFVFSSLLTQRQFGEQNFAIGTLNRPDFLNNFQSLVTAEQPLFDAGKTRRAVRTAELGYALAGEDLRRSRMETIAQVVRLYLGAQLGAAQLEATAQALQSAESDLERAEARRAAGMATDADVLSIRVHLAGVREERIRRAADLEVARAAVNDVLGLPLDTRREFTTALAPLALPALDAASLERSGAESRPEVRESRLAREISNLAVSDARSNLLPQVALRGAFESDRQRFYNRAGANWLVSIGLKWNLFNGFADQARIAESAAQVRRAEADESRVASAVRLQVRRAFADLKAAEERIATARAAVAQAEESLRIAQNRYGAGLETVTDLLRTETALYAARTRLLAAVHDQRVAAALLELAAGILNPDSEVLQ
jgi:outer membrane protein TolC